MSAPRSFAENVVFAGLSAATNGLALILILYAAQVLSTEENGLLQIALAFAAIGEPLMDFGLHQASIRQIARDRSSARDVLANSIPMKALSGAGMCVGLSIIALAWYPAAAPGALLMLGSAAIRSYLLTVRGVLQGLEHFRHDAVVMCADRAFMLAGGAAALWLGGGVPGLALSFVLTRAAALLIALALTRRHVETITISFDTAAWRALRDSAVPLGAFLTVLTVYNYVDQLLLARLSSEWDVGVYGNVYKIYEALTYGSGILASVLTPRFAALWATDRAAHRHLAWRGVAGAAALGCAVGAVAWMAAPLAVRLLFPPDYLEGVRALRILSSGLGLVFAIWILHALAMSTFNARLLLQTTLVSLLINIGLNVWLIPTWHRDGAAVATLGGEAVALVMLVIGMHRQLRQTT
jgi:O-antigen/teichoic acid export membrane protein